MCLLEIFQICQKFGIGFEQCWSYAEIVSFETQAIRVCDPFSLNKTFQCRKFVPSNFVS